jgi:hypothetical protein
MHYVWMVVVGFIVGLVAIVLLVVVGLLKGKSSS